MVAQLAPVYLDDNRVTLQGDPKPKVSKILLAGGKEGTDFEVVRLRSQDDNEGTTVGADEVIDRTAQSDYPVYLRSREGGERDAGSERGTEQFGAGREGQSSQASMQGKSKQELVKPALHEEDLNQEEADDAQTTDQAKSVDKAVDVKPNLTKTTPQVKPQGGEQVKAAAGQEGKVPLKEGAKEGVKAEESDAEESEDTGSEEAEEDNKANRA